MILRELFNDCSMSSLRIGKSFIFFDLNTRIRCGVSVVEAGMSGTYYRAYSQRLRSCVKLLPLLLLLSNHVLDV